MEEIRILDKGFVRLVETMGGDQGVVQSARVSYGGGSKGDEKDRKLIEYLLQHRHMTPFEQAVFKFHISCPIFVMRQWIRHRMACVSGDAELCFDLPSGPRRGFRKSCTMKVEEFYRKWHEGAKPIPHAKKPSSQVVVPQRERLRGMLLRSLDEERRTFYHTHVTDIFKTGEKPVFEVALENGKKITCTKDHRFLFENGWQTLEDATGLTLQEDLAVHGHRLPRLTVNGRFVETPLYRDREWLETQYRRPRANDKVIASVLGVSSHVIRKWRKIHGLLNIKPRGFEKGITPWNKGRSYSLWAGKRPLSAEHLAAIRKARSGTNSNFWRGGVSSSRSAISRWTTQTAKSVFQRDETILCPKWVRIASIQYAGLLPTYDITVEGPFHNYVANGIVTHNSYNEISARYTEVQDEYYVPSAWRSQDTKNKQGSLAAPSLDQKALTAAYDEQMRSSLTAYRKLLAAGAARELARMVLPVSLYTQFYWTVNARSLMHFLGLRAEAHAQWEIQQYAEALARIFEEKMPWTYRAFLKHSWKGGNAKLDAQKEKACAD